MKTIKYTVYFAVIIFFITAFNNGNIDLSEFKYIKYKSFNERNIKGQIIKVIKGIITIKVDKKIIIDKAAFPIDESSVIKKYNKANYYEKGSFESYYHNKKYFYSPYLGFRVDNSFEKTPVKFPFNDGFIIGQITERVLIDNDERRIFGISFFSYEKEKAIQLFGIESIDEKIKYTDASEIRLLDIKDGQFLVLAIYNEKQYQEVDELHNHFKIYKFNLKTKEVRIWDSRENNLTMYIDTYYLNYDLSKDRRYIYMSFMYGYSGYDGEKGLVSEGGVYIFDWWEEKIYKIFEPMSVDGFKKIAGEKMKSDGSIYYEVDVKVVNNTNDGYVYAMWAGTNEEFQYVRFKNPEEMLK